MNFFRNGGDFYQFLACAIDSAKQEILISVYSFHNDVTGRRLLGHLAAAARRGVRVQLLFDGVGSWGDKYGVVRELREAGGEARIFRPWRRYFVRHPILFFRRNHTRIFLIDRKLFGLGGICVGNIYASREDLFILFPVSDARPILLIFNDLWERAAPERERALSADMMHGTIAPGIVAVSSGPCRKDEHTYKWILEAIRGAQERIVIVTAWFFPPREVVDELVEAHRRGVSIAIVTPLQTDREAYDGFRALPLSPLLGCGVSWYGTGHYFHQKFFIVDDRWNFGSANFDTLSLKRNYECNIVGTGGRILTELIASFQGLVDGHRPRRSSPIPRVFRWAGALSYGFLTFLFTAGGRGGK
jgi:cardiolipin synthase A/B